MKRNTPGALRAMLASMQHAPQPNQDQLATALARAIMDGREFTPGTWEKLSVYGDQKITEELMSRAAKKLEDWGERASAGIVRVRAKLAKTRSSAG